MNMPVVCTTTSAQYGDMGVDIPEVSNVIGKFIWITVIQFFGFIEFCMAAFRRITPEAFDT